MLAMLVAAGHPEPDEIPINDERVRQAMQEMAIEEYHDLEAVRAAAGLSHTAAPDPHEDGDEA